MGFISGTITGYFEANNTAEPVLSVLLTTLVTVFLVLTWYHIDSNEHRFQRSAWLNVLIVGFALVGVPYYLYKSRVPEQRGRAFGRLVGFTFVYFCFSILGEYLIGVWL